MATVVPHLCERDGAGWRELGGLDGTVYSLAGRAGSDLLAAGYFTHAGGVPVDGIARWDGAAWSPLPAGFSGPTATLAAGEHGEFLAVGWVPGSSGLAWDVATWDGATWQGLGATPMLGSSPGECRVVVPCADRAVVIGGSFDQVGGSPATDVARFDGSTWAALGAGPGASVNCAVELADKTIVVGTVQGPAGTPAAACVARWAGGVRQPLGTGTNGTGAVEQLLALPGGDVLASGYFTLIGGQTCNGLARWDGAAWHPVDGLDGHVTGMALEASGDVVFTGQFLTAGGKPSLFVTRMRAAWPPRVDESGAGCTGAGGSNRLETLDQPWLGEVFDTRATGLAPLSIGALLVGDLAASVTLDVVLPQALPGCELSVSAPQLVLFVTGSGTVDLPLVIPASPTLLAHLFALQVVVAEVTTGGSIGAFTSSNTLAARIGSF